MATRNHTLASRQSAWRMSHEGDPDASLTRGVVGAQFDQ
jgi:hypothetical protein